MVMLSKGKGLSGHAVYHFSPAGLSLFGYEIVQNSGEFWSLIPYHALQSASIAAL